MAPLSASNPDLSSLAGCNKAKMADFAQAQQRGYLEAPDIMTLTGMDTISCGVACMYYQGCFSFDISTSDECRLLGTNNLLTCGTQFALDDSYLHFDRVFVA